jgi:chromosome segregation ATPase
VSDGTAGVVGTPSSLPIPDPTLLTAKSIREAIEAERQRADAVQEGERFRHDADAERLQGAINVILQRIQDSDVALRLLSETVNRVPSETDLKTGQLGILIEEKIKGVYAVLGEREKRTTEAAALADTALKAAFKAQQDAATEQNKANEKAIAVSAEATAKTIAKNEQLATAGVSGLDTRFTELKDQVADLRADIRAVTSQRQGGNTAIAATISVIVAVVAVIGLVVTIVATR